MTDNMVRGNPTSAGISGKTKNRIIAPTIAECLTIAYVPVLTNIIFSSPVTLLASLKYAE